MLSKNITKHSTRLLSVIILVAMALPSLASTITVEHISGRTVFQKHPQRVVVLGNASLDVLDQMDIQPVGAPHSLLPDYLAKYKTSTGNTGTVAEPDFEAIYFLKPDIIIAENRMLSLYDQLNKIAPTVMFYVKADNYWQDAKKNWMMLAKLFDKEALVTSIINQTEMTISSVKTQVKAKNLSALMLMNNGNNIAMFNKGSRFSILFDEFGFSESSSNNMKPIKGTHGNLISFEYIADSQPGALFILDREQAIGYGSGKAKTMFDNPLVRTTPASKNNRIIFMDTNAWYISNGGITATQRMLSDVIDSLK